jgi:hypothetical protein
MTVSSIPVASDPFSHTRTVALFTAWPTRFPSSPSAVSWMMAHVNSRDLTMANYTFNDCEEWQGQLDRVTGLLI